MVIQRFQSYKMVTYIQSKPKIQFLMKSNESSHHAIEEVFLPSTSHIDIKDEPMDYDFQDYQKGGIFSDLLDSYNNIKAEDIDIKYEYDQENDPLENYDEPFHNARTRAIRTYSNRKFKKTDDRFLNTEKVIPFNLSRVILQMKIIDEKIRVFTSTIIPKGLKFGPVVSNVNNPNSDWLICVNIPCLVKDCNLIAYKENDSIYYQTSREINKGEELTLYFAEEFVESLGLDPKKSYEFICTPCHLAFLSKLYFIKHKMKCQYSPKNGIARCPYCELVLHEPKYLELHMKRCETIHEKKLDRQNTVETTEGGFSTLNIFNCSQCEYQPKNYAASKIHALSHYITTIFKCNVCNNEFGSRDALRKHKKSSHRKKIVHNCIYCTYKSTHKYTLTCHIKARHTNDKRFVCPLCPLRFIDKSKMLCHYKVHEGSRDFLCEVCSKSFTRKDNLRVHMNIHLDLRFTCSKCDYESHYKAILKEHMKKKHKLDDSVIEEHITELLKKMKTDQT